MYRRGGDMSALSGALLINSLGKYFVRTLGVGLFISSMCVQLAAAMHFVEKKYAVGQYPIFVAVADFNNDTNPDLAVANYNSGTVSVLLGNGDGTFRQAVNYTVGSSPTSIALGDFNGDHNLDLAVGSYGKPVVHILLGRGDGTFHSPVNYPAGDSVGSVAVGDFNRDGKLDLVVTDSHGVATLLGKGDGSFRSPIITNYGQLTVTVKVADFNNDGKLDVAAKAGNLQIGDTRLTVLLGDGTGKFHVSWSDNPHLAINSFVVGGLNADGKVDLVALYNTSVGFGIRLIQVLLGNGDGTFRYGWKQQLGLPGFITRGDFNNDHRTDLAIFGLLSTNPLYVFLGNGNGTFQTKQTFTLTAKPYFMIVQDLNHDGRGDIVLANFSQNTISVLRNVVYP
jgi:hypothetical protein